ncbi:trypsin-1 [Anabrus simplex]|uniref:trypsin-1 n=1 Tax=Anabrus simplex TaxID=316456 RepID=UPI0035A3C053
MLRLPILINLLGFCFARNSKPTMGRIVGGEKADIKDFPYQVAFLEDNDVMCGASIIGEEWALTAAHCVVGMKPKEVTLRVGSSSYKKGGEVHKATELKKHKKYSDKSDDNDIALIKVSPPFKFTDKVKAIELNEKAVKGGTKAIVTGWGVTKEDNPDVPATLRKVEIPVVDHAKCAKMLEGITANMLCAGYEEGKKDACQGDSGGPLAADGKLIGVVSFGEGCAEPNSPGVYTDVSKYRKWIKDNAGI